VLFFFVLWFENKTIRNGKKKKKKKHSFVTVFVI
jgi:hypothetical protein